MKNYFAKSVAVSKTMWFNIGAFIVAAAGLSQVTDVIPLRLMPTFAAIVALVNLALRTFTVRPVAFIAPGKTKAVAVHTLPTTNT